MVCITKTQINTAITDIVKEYLSKGYEIDLIHSRPSSCVDLINKNDSNDIIRISRGEEYTRVYNSVQSDGTPLRVRCDFILTSKRTPDSWYSCEGDTIKKDVFYNIAKQNDAPCYVSSIDEYLNIINIRNKRIANRRDISADKCIDVNKVTPKFKDLIMNRVKSVRGMSRAKYNVVKLIRLFKDPNDPNKKLRANIVWNTDERHGRIYLG